MDARARAELEDTSRSATLPEKAAGPLGIVRALGPGRIAALGGVTLAFLGFFASILAGQRPRLYTAVRQAGAFRQRALGAAA